MTDPGGRWPGAGMLPPAASPRPGGHEPGRVKHTPVPADAPKVTLVEPGPTTGPAPTAAGGRDGTSTAAPVRRLLGAGRLEHAAVLCMLALLEVPLVHEGGGRGSGMLAWYAAAAVVAAVLTRPWNRLPRTWTAAAAGLALAPLLVLVATGGGRAGTVAATTYGATALTLVVVAAYARTPARRAAVAALVCAGGVAQFAWALVPWWGGGDPAAPMVGTFDWHNQYAAALLAPALLGLTLALSGSKPWRAAGWVAMPLAVAGVVLSTSRTTLALLVVGWIAVVAVSLLAAAGRTARGRVVSSALVATVLAVGLTVILPGPPLFTTGASPLSGTAARTAAGETLSNNGTYRAEFWAEALTAFRAHPLSGAGFGRIAAASRDRVPANWAISPLAHSGPMQALGDGGLLLGGPLALAAGCLCVALLRRLRRPAGRQRLGTAPADADRAARRDQILVRASALTALLMVAHAMVDTDWTYPALAAELAVVAALALAAGAVTAGEKYPARSYASWANTAGRAAAGLLLLAVSAGGVAAWGQPFHISAPHTTSGGGHS